MIGNCILLQKLQAEDLIIHKASFESSTVVATVARILHTRIFHPTDLHGVQLKRNIKLTHTICESTDGNCDGFPPTSKERFPGNVSTNFHARESRQSRRNSKVCPNPKEANARLPVESFF